MKNVELTDAERLYTNLPSLSNQKHTMLVLYSPSCQYCLEMEKEVGWPHAAAGGGSDA